MLIFGDLGACHKASWLVRTGQISGNWWQRSEETMPWTWNGW